MSWWEEERRHHDAWLAERRRQYAALIAWSEATTVRERWHAIGLVPQLLLIMWGLYFALDIVDWLIRLVTGAR